MNDGAFCEGGTDMNDWFRRVEETAIGVFRVVILVWALWEHIKHLPW